MSPSLNFYDLPISTVYSFGKLGIGKWGKQELPMLVVNPFNLPKDWDVYKQWSARTKVDKKNTHLVFWYGSGKKRTQAFSFIPKSAIVSLDKKIVVQRLDKVLLLTKPTTKNAKKYHAVLRRRFEELKGDLDKSVDELQRKFSYPENKKKEKAIEEKKSSSKKAGNKPQASSQQGEDDRVIARIRLVQENGKYGPPKDILFSDLLEEEACRENGIQQHSIELKRGGHLRFIAGMVSPKQCRDVTKEMETIEYRRYPLKSLNSWEPRVHLLLSKTANPPSNIPKEKKSMGSHAYSEEDPEYGNGEYQDDCSVESLPETAKGYKYHSVNMLAHPISDFKAIERVDEYVANFFDTDFNIGVDALCYRDGKDYIGFHADDTQGEDIVLCLTVESVCQRVLRIKPKGELCVGDEQIDLFPCAGDGYSMDGIMQRHYLHSLQQACSANTVAAGRRFALVFRNGKVTSVGKDTGRQVESLKPDPSGPVRYSFGDIECVQQGQEYTKSRLVASGAHRKYLGGVSGNRSVGCDAITVSRSSPNYREEDHFSWLRYSSNGKQGLRALYASWKLRKPVRVFRSSNLANHFRASSPQKNHQLFRYDGLYKVTNVWNDKGEKDPSVLPQKALPLEYTFLLERSSGEDGNLNETDFFAECKRRKSMPAFLEHTIDWTVQSKAPTSLPPIQQKAVPSSVTQVGISEPTTRASVPLTLGEETSPMVEEIGQVETGMQEPSSVTQVSISEPTTPESFPPPLGEKTPPIVEETRQVETGMQEAPRNRLIQRVCRFFLGISMLVDGKGETKEKKRKCGNEAAEARGKAAKKAKKQRGGGGDSDNDSVSSKPDDKNETGVSRNSSQMKK